MSDVKKAVRNVLLRYQKEQGTEAALAVAKHTLKMYLKPPQDVADAHFKTDFNGEICETVLEMLLNDYVAKHAASAWRINKGIILSDPSKPKGNRFLTEIDMLLMTPQCFYVFECKSYSGDKILSGKGFLSRTSGNGCDVFKQNSMHLEVLQKWLDRLSSSPRYQMVMFDFSDGSIKDKRPAQYRNKMPCVDESSLFSIFSQNLNNVWSADIIKRLHEMFNRETDAVRRKHLAYVKSMHR